MPDIDTSHTTAEENFKATFGHYPIRVELPEPTPDPRLDALIARWFNGGQPPRSRGTDQSQTPMSQSNFDQACDRLATAEGYLTTAAHSIERIDASLATELRDALARVRTVTNRLVQLEESQRQEGGRS